MILFPNKRSVLDWWKRAVRYAELVGKWRQTSLAAFQEHRMFPFSGAVRQSSSALALLELVLGCVPSGEGSRNKVRYGEVGARESMSM